MEKLVVKTAVKTVLIILGIFIGVFAIFNFAFPQHMATVTESIGNYDLAVKYASLRYHYTKSCSDLARCFDDSVLLGKDEYVLQYGEQLVTHRDYPSVCKEKNVLQTGSGYDYDHWVRGKLVISYYNTGEKDKAFEKAKELNGDTSFAYGNAVMTLAGRARTENDSETIGKILTFLEKIRTNFEKTPPSDRDELTNLNKVISALESR